ncbi:MAG TPA: hypothetical protein VHY91_14395 [Pirellulales bacterium]|jgi:hypothetical protein|nr:hypothetical protein [Pirellulales bacterium]
MDNEAMVGAIDFVSRCHATRLARGIGHGAETDPQTIGQLLTEFSGYRKRQTFGDALDAWLAKEYDLDDASRAELIELISAQPLPADQLSTILTDAGVNVDSFSTAHIGILTAALLEEKAPDGEISIIAALVAAGARWAWENETTKPVVAAWADFHATVFTDAVSRAIAKVEK